jgi:hypothetical protein
MDQKSWLVASDLASGIIAAVMAKLQNQTSQAMMYRPFIENVVYSVIGRMSENYLASKMWSRAGVDDKTPGTAYIRTEAGRSSTIIFIASYIVAYVMKSKNKFEKTMTAVSSDVLGNELINAFFATDTVLIAGSK